MTTIDVTLSPALSATDPQKGGIDGHLASDDRAALDAIGKKAVFERRFNFWTALGITVCISGTVSASKQN